ncbi:hypothetical protein BGW36DRAFT_465869 [Talaromyces proteolyticus]|uniref:Aspartate/glutamate racemase family protein n=1 Tax=Talaromyces proteolyticus TaxID=1131652 RepID=A0AAD4KDV0_9EURO|nr:uncharacterized protein BGW36DRAFT_465869 [Talaromyces proteolyticus]KAH8689882.1 hypothetical protein BGW36DRAFT_465869 [Talaromyces proteolyticus]
MADKQLLPPLGFIAIDVHFHRPPGDAFNESTWPFPLIHIQAEGSSESEVVTKGAYDAALIDRFVEAGLKLAARGCVGIITSCGFLAMAQQELSARLPIPIATSSLLQIPSLLAFLPPGKTIGILTYDDARLGPDHLTKIGLSCGAVSRTRIVGAPANGHLRRLIQHGAPYVHADIEKELVEIARNMVIEYSDIGGILLECTQMPPFAGAIQRAVRLPVYDVYTMGCWFYSGLQRNRPLVWGAVESS